MCLPGLFGGTPEPEAVAPASVAPVAAATEERQEIAEDPRRFANGRRTARQRAIAAAGGKAGGTVLTSPLGVQAPALSGQAPAVGTATNNNKTLGV